ncbi:hypothetical protein [Streptomyces sp. NPDC002889]|uniref:hypothetical protein n=1 Tax=Streptomyces sp. NPDC002889 TaxID=3364669 RepID=UPI0036B40B7D
MADERYEWLDRDAAERLLRGEPVEATDERARAQAARLSETLSSARSGAYQYEDGELPGEAAAMAAFRKARAEAADAAGPVVESLGAVRVVRADRRAGAVRFGRPVRFGIAAAVAGCALGGVAVAAGAGVLPAPFGGHDNPLPASSVSAAETPGTLASEPPGGWGQSTPPPSPGAITTPPVPSATGGASPTPGLPGTGTPGGQPTGGGQDEPEQGSDNTSTDWYRKSVEACKDYRRGRIDGDRRERLESAAKGAERVERFCDRLLSGNGSGDYEDDGGSGDGDSGSDGSGDSSDSDPDRSGDGRDSDGRLRVNPLVPPVSWPAGPDAAEVPVPSLRPVAIGDLSHPV